MSITFQKETISPSKAKAMLRRTAELGFVNRTPGRSYVNRYAGDIEKGHWETDTGETIKVTTKGAVIDGQHRLHAIIQANVSVKLWVCHGIQERMFQYIDQGSSRTLDDIMSIEGWDKPRILATTGKMLWRADRTGDPLKSPRDTVNESDGNIYEWLKAVQPNLLEEWQVHKTDILNAYRECHKAIPESMLFYLLYTWKQEDSDAALLFFEYLAGGVLASPDHPAMAFLKQFSLELQAEQNQGGGRTRGRHGDTKELLMAAANHAWSLIMEGKNTVRTFSGFKRGMTRATNLLKEEQA